MEAKVKQFLKVENCIASNTANASVTNEVAGSSVSNMANGHNKTLPSFWVPSKTPNSKTIRLQKPVIQIISIVFIP